MENLINEIIGKMDNLPLPKKPASFGGEYAFPEDVQHLTSQQLGAWMFKLAAWRGYVIRAMTYKEVGFKFMEDKYDSEMSRSIASIQTKAKNKETAIGTVLNGSEDLRKQNENLTVKGAEILALKRVLEIYTVQSDVISREISRRQLEAKGM